VTLLFLTIVNVIFVINSHTKCNTNFIHLSIIVISSKLFSHILLFCHAVCSVNNNRHLYSKTCTQCHYVYCQCSMCCSTFVRFVHMHELKNCPLCHRLMYLLNYLSYARLWIRILGIFNASFKEDTLSIIVQSSPPPAGDTAFAAGNTQVNFGPGLSETETSVINKAMVDIRLRPCWCHLANSTKQNQRNIFWRALTRSLSCQMPMPCYVKTWRHPQTGSRLYCRLRNAELWSQLTCTENLIKLCFLRYASRQTDIHPCRHRHIERDTYKRSQYFTSLPRAR